MKTGVFVTRDRVKQVLAGISSLGKSDVLVGIPGENATRDAPITNAALGYIHEFGAPEANIPARPHLVPGVQDAKEQVTARFKHAAKSAFMGRPAEVDRALNAAGIIATSSVKRKITSGPFLPLAPSTLAARRRRGRTGAKPLIDTGQYRNSITYVLRTNAGKALVLK